MADSASVARENSIAIISDLIEVLAPITMTKAGVAAHIWRLITSRDEYLQVGGMCVLIDSGGLRHSHWQKALEISHHMAVRVRLFDHFLEKQEYKLAEQLVNGVKSVSYPTAREKMEAQLVDDWQKLADIERRIFLENGQLQHLLKASGHAETNSGWHIAAIWALRALLVDPLMSKAAYRSLKLLDDAHRYEELGRLVQIFDRANIHSNLRWVFEAGLCLHENDHPKLEKVIKSIALDRLQPKAKSKVYNTMARACAAQGNYQEAHSWFVRQNLIETESSQFDRNAFVEGVERLAAIDISELSQDHNIRHYMMVGFPRSGTTLLENSLAAHPHIETFEEMPSTSVMFRTISVAAAQPSSGPDKRAAFEEARERYYADIRRRMKKASAIVFIDKMPMNSAYIETFEKVFPQKKYIFSVRHPYDVVLSCFQQRFKTNAAMVNFNRFEDTCRIYDMTMKKWFSIFPGPTKRVHYVRYDNLVQNFEDEIRELLAFLNLDWNDAVREFASAAAQRKVATPSYNKVRAGLTLGVQSSWKNYAFLFERAEARLLQQWVERFGYQAV